MRKLIFSLLLASAGVIGLAGAAPAEAYDSARIYVGIGDVVFSYGRPYWRHNSEPLYVVYERGYPRYYRLSSSSYYAPTYYAPPAYHYAPPVRYYDDRRGYRDHHRWDRDRGRHDRDRRDRGRHHRGRGW
jgi:hypothetical protein